MQGVMLIKYILFQRRFSCFCVSTHFPRIFKSVMLESRNLSVVRSSDASRGKSRRGSEAIGASSHLISRCA